MAEETQSPATVARNALLVVAVILAGAALLWGASILTPLVLALFLLVMVDGFARLLTRMPFLPDWAALPVALVLTALGFGLTVYVVVNNAAAFVGELIKDLPRLNAVIAQIGAAFGVQVPPTVQQIIDQINPQKYVGDIARSLQAFGGSAATVLIYLGFLIASRQGFEKKVGALFPDSSEREHAIAVFVRVRNGVERYLWIQTVTGAVIALAAWALMALIGLPNAVFWGFLIFVACYVPVIGGAVGTVLPPLFALVQFPSFWPGLLLFIGLEVIMFVIGNVIQPRMQRDSLNIDPVVVLLSLALWGAIWGIPGMFLSTPLTVTGIIILAQFEGTRWIA
ncbi:MAG: AI-2E family transporter, partial [Pseudomonadota bacterium]|nr:AI-2E family transporter [Pseudomonadota bacterium]